MTKHDLLWEEECKKDQKEQLRMDISMIEYPNYDEILDEIEKVDQGNHEN